MEEEKILINNPLSFREALVEYHVKTKQPDKPKSFNNCATKLQDQGDRKGTKKQKEDDNLSRLLCSGKHNNWMNARLLMI